MSGADSGNVRQRAEGPEADGRPGRGDGDIAARTHRRLEQALSRPEAQDLLRRFPQLRNLEGVDERERERTFLTVLSSLRHDLDAPGERTDAGGKGADNGRA